MSQGLHYGLVSVMIAFGRNDMSVHGVAAKDMHHARGFCGSERRPKHGDDQMVLAFWSSISQGA